MSPNIFPGSYILKDGVYVPTSPGEEAFGYSDGDQTEQRILKIIEKTGDKSVVSQTLRREIVDWPTQYHLSPLRANLLRPFSSLFRGLTLEVGAGCGAITRYLGELGSDIIALEGSGRRCQIARARTADLKNVIVVNDRVERFSVNRAFDVITLIGVLEYSSIYNGEGPAGLLSRLYSLLNPGGILVVAIENQLGLKYLSGAAEDHIGRPFYGVHGLYQDGEPTTYGQGALSAILKDSGFECQRWYSPLPDYKLPVTIVSPSGLENFQGFCLQELLKSSVAVDPQMPRQPAFNLECAWPVVAGNGLAGALANSFLVVASKSQAALGAMDDGDILAWHYSVNRHPAFAKEARFVRNGSRVDVKRRRVCDVAAPALPIRCLVEDEPYRSGRLWWGRLPSILHREGWSIGSVSGWARVWLDALRQIVGGDLSTESLLDGRFFDAVPFNLIVDEQGEAHFIDLEWVVETSIPFGMLLVRGLRESFFRVANVAEPALGTPLNGNHLVIATLANLGYLLAPQDIDRYSELEGQIQAWVQGRLVEDQNQLVARREGYWSHRFEILTTSRGISEASQQLNTMTATVRQLLVEVSTLKETVGNLIQGKFFFSEQDEGFCDDRVVFCPELESGVFDFVVEFPEEGFRVIRYDPTEMIAIAMKIVGAEARTQDNHSLNLSELSVESNGTPCADGGWNFFTHDPQITFHACKSIKALRIIGEWQKLTEAMILGELTDICQQLERGRGIDEVCTLSFDSLLSISTDSSVIPNNYEQKGLLELDSKTGNFTVEFSLSFAVVPEGALFWTPCVGRYYRCCLDDIESDGAVKVVTAKGANRADDGWHDFFDPSGGFEVEADWSSASFLRFRGRLELVGNEVVVEALIARLEMAKKESVICLQDTNATLLKQRGEIDALRDSLREAVEASKANFSMLDRIISEQSFRLTSLSEELVEKDRTLAQKDGQIQELKELQKTSEEHIGSFQVKLCGQESHLANVSQVVQMLSERENVLESVIQETSEVLRQLHNSLPAQVDTLYSEIQEFRERDILRESELKSLKERVVKLANRRLSERVKRLPSAIRLQKRLRKEIRTIQRSGLFDQEYYTNCYQPADSRKSPLVYFATVGWREGHNPHPLFDVEYYLSQCPEVSQAGVNPLFHYLTYGWQANLNPHPLFNTKLYRSENPDVDATGSEPLSHFCRHGWREARRPHHLFDIGAYLEARPDLKGSDVNPLIHYVLYGWGEGTNPHPLFDVAFYLGEYADLLEDGEEPLGHYCIKGWMEGLVPHPLFDPAFYSDNRSDAATSEQPSLIHYLEIGWRDGTNPHPLFDVPYYLAENHDVAEGGQEPLSHYCTHGFREGRKPHELFDPKTYLEHRPDLSGADINALIHYCTWGWQEGATAHPLFAQDYYLSQLAEEERFCVNPLINYYTIGWKRGLNPHPLFDVKFYLGENADVSEAALEPLTHFLSFGWREERNPHPLFDTKAYLKTYPHLIEQLINPLTHYLLDDFKRRQDPCPTRESHEFVPLSVENPLETSAVKAICFYLPQFHEIPENNEWWGTGFTEWTNVRPAKPLFIGHYQPHEPGELGYYNLLDSKVQRRQVELAKLYGVGGFCFYYYWFAGKTLLDRPTENYLGDSTLDLPFCLCWANENWTRRWDGKDQDVLIAQEHSADDDIAFISHISRFLRDNRYIRVKGKPLLVVYRPSLLPDPAATATRWRTWCRLNNIGEIYLAYTQSFELNNPAEYGFDAAIEFSPMNSAPPRAGAPIVPFAQNPHAHIYDWRVFKERAKRIEWPSYTYFRGVNPSWDNTPRRRINSPTIFLHSSPQVYGEWLDEVATATIDHYKDPSERLVFINAWNEWAEGAHLEPDRRYGYAWLQATRDALANASRYSGEIVDVTPNKHPDLLSRRWAQIEEIFGAALDRDRYSFLTDYSALLDQLVKDCDGASSFFNTDGIPCCSLSDGSEIRLVSRRSLTLLTSAYPALSGSHGPICFVILQYNKPQITMECVRALKAVTANDDNVHIIIVDNGSEKENEELITRRFASDCQVSVLTTGANLGFAQGNNVGYRFARESLGASFIVVLNNDVVIRTSDFISQMLALYQDWSYSILGPDIVTPDGRRENPYNDWIYSEREWADLLKSYEERREQYLAGGGADFTKFGRATPSRSLIANPILQGAIFIASPIFVNRHDEMFDPRTFLYGEEFLLAARALHDGDLLLYSNELQVAHEEGCTTADLADHRKILLGYDNPIAAVRMILEAIRMGEAGPSRELLVITPEECLPLIDSGKLNVLVDLFFCQPGYHGGGEYGKAVFRELIESCGDNTRVQLWVAADTRQYIDQWVWELCAQHGCPVIDVTSFSAIIDLVQSDSFDVFFCPAIVVYTGYEYMRRVGANLPFSCKKTKIIGGLFDLRDLELVSLRKEIQAYRYQLGCSRGDEPEPSNDGTGAFLSSVDESELREMYQGILANEAVTKFITISEYSRSSMDRQLGDVGEKVEVLYAPMKSRPAPVPFALDGIDLASDPFALVLNMARIEKNAAGAIRAFEHMASQYGSESILKPNFKVLLVGGADFRDAGLEDVQCRDLFLFLPHLPPEHLEYLLQQAQFLVYVSLNEGFGYPPLEAMSYGTPSIVANCTAPPEVFGDAAIYCDPFSVESIVAGIEKMLRYGVDKERLEKRYKEVTSRQESDLAALVSEILGQESSGVDSAQWSIAV